LKALTVVLTGVHADSLLNFVFNFVFNAVNDAAIATTDFAGLRTAQGHLHSPFRAETVKPGCTAASDPVFPTFEFLDAPRPVFAEEKMLILIYLIELRIID